MGLNIRSEEVNRLATELAEKRKITKTEAVRLALANELARKGEEKSLWEKIAPIRASVAAAPKTGLPADKAFFDEINGDY
ncbi:transcription factor [Pleomorphomonas diazotrophica]|uniref:Transcription factor n=1 Tax=Pleomorphomonas diazotrophica TaxID=1166257 RepID=A0A1I4WPV4_9HYPH|nr:type II toxin-antitoxin system VapB family antitoxin [Pleomorphomonas diazotrophica]PKR87193.1 transcription factor [Pleomorphomonas diazotrophica]SFN15049.1 antitoxin VapB [Pleomorphomonas diazotrophica]